MLVTGTGNSQASAQSVTTTTPAAAAAGKHLYFFWQTDSGGAQTVTPPSGASELLAPAGADARMAIWKLALTGAPDANYTVTTDAIAANIALNIVCVDFEGGAFVSDTVVARTFATSATSTSSTATNAGDVSALLMMFANDDNFAITTPPATMTLLNHTDMSASELATYYEIGFTTGTRALVWSGVGDVQCGGVVVRSTAAPAGPTITTQPVAGTAVVNESSISSLSFTVAATSSGGALTYDWELETSVGGGVYANLADGSGATWTGQTAATATGTFTATTLTGRRVRVNVTDDNGTTTSSAVALTVYTGPVLVQPGVTNGSGVSTTTYTTDFPVSTFAGQTGTEANGWVQVVTATVGSVTKRFASQPTPP